MRFAYLSLLSNYLISGLKVERDRTEVEDSDLNVLLQLEEAVGEGWIGAVVVGGGGGGGLGLT